MLIFLEPFDDDWGSESLLSRTPRPLCFQRRWNSNIQQNGFFFSSLWFKFLK
jgi:hypothetical protein